MLRAIEITTFRLSSGLTIDDFIAANADIDPWLQHQPGFVSRHICERKDGEVLDMLVWDSAAAGHHAAIGVTTEMAASPVHATIDQSTVTWTIAEARHSV
jgi:hypothetical protein